jgi:DNA-binding transcriptional regulator YiaG
MHADVDASDELSGDALKAARQGRFTQEQLAHLLRRPVMTVSSWERPRHRRKIPPHMQRVLRLILDGKLTSPPSPMKGAALVKMLQNAGGRQSDLAKRMHIHRQAVSAWVTAGEVPPLWAALVREELRRWRDEKRRVIGNGRR